MPKKRLILLISFLLLTLIIIGSIIGAFLRLIRFTLGYLIPLQLIAPIMLITALVIIIIVVQFAWPLIHTFTRKVNQRKINPKIKYRPKNSKSAAQKSLESIDLLIDKIRNNVSREALKRERTRVENELSRGDLVLVVFGTGSSGKTSLIRALLNEIVGEVGAQMGSTKASKKYRLRLKGLERGIQIIDTPGILEAGKEGISREKEAREKAISADLLIVVIDRDLRSTELQTIQSMGNLGKRILLVLNKCDLLGDEEVRRLLYLLTGHCKNIIDAKDVLATSASPQTIPRIGENPIKPSPEIQSLLNRLAKILYEEGDELLANNILLQCKNLGENGKKLLNSQRTKYAKKTIDKYSWISSGVVVATPLPGIDFIGAAAVNAQMVIEIAKIYGVELTKNRAQELAVSVGKTIAGLGIIKGSVNLITTALSLSVPTLVIGRAIQGIATAWLTRVAGASFITYFQQDQDWGDGGLQDVVQKHYDLNKRSSSLEQFLEIAVRKVIDPLNGNGRKQLPPRQRLQEEEEALDRERLE